MNWQGWVFMVTAWSVVIGLFAWSFWKVLKDE